MIGVSVKNSRAEILNNLREGDLIEYSDHGWLRCVESVRHFNETTFSVYFRDSDLVDRNLRRVRRNISHDSRVIVSRLIEMDAV